MSNEKEIRTGIWEKTSEKGTRYGYGKITIEGKEYKVVLFKVGEKKSEKSPDFNLILEEIKENKDKKNEEVFADFGDNLEVTDEDLCF